MPSTHVEENLRFTFDDHWQVVKLDEHAFFRKNLMPLQWTKAVDFLAVFGRAAVFLVEVKDYRGSAIALKNDEKMGDGDTLMLQVARKVKDSIACLVAAARTTNDRFWADCAEMVHARRAGLFVVFWLEFDIGHRVGSGKPEMLLMRLKSAAVTRQNELKRALRWLTKSVIVTNQAIATSQLPGVTVENVARAGHR